MTERWRLPVQHILTAVADIGEHTAGMDRSAFLENRLVIQAVERNIEIISEASRRLPDVMKDRHHEIPWPEIASIGNRLRHRYDDVDPVILWNIAQNDLPPLKTAVEAMAEKKS